MTDVKIKVSAAVREAQAELKKVSEALKETAESSKDIGIKAGVAFAALSGLIGVSINEYAKSEEAVRALNTSLAGQGIYTEELSRKYQELATEIQKKTKFSDDDVIAGLATVQAQLGQIEVTDELTQAVADYAAANKIDLKAAFEAVSSTLGGTRNAFKSVGVEVDVNASKQEKLAQITEGLTQKYKGFAEGQAAGLGVLSQLKNSIGDLAENLGKQFAPYVERAARALKSLVDTINKNESAFKIGAAVIAIGAAFTGLTAAVTGAIVAINSATASLAALHISLLPIIGTIAAISAAVVGIGVAWKSNFLGLQESVYGLAAAFRALNLKDLVIIVAEVVAAVKLVTFAKGAWALATSGLLTNVNNLGLSLASATAKIGTMITNVTLATASFLKLAWAKTVVVAEMAILAAGFATISIAVDLVIRNFKNLGDLGRVAFAALAIGAKTVAQSIAQIFGDDEAVKRYEEDINGLLESVSGSVEKLDFGVGEKAITQIKSVFAAYKQGANERHEQSKAEEKDDAEKARLAKLNAEGVAQHRVEVSKAAQSDIDAAHKEAFEREKTHLEKQIDLIGKKKIEEAKSAADVQAGLKEQEALVNRLFDLKIDRIKAEKGASLESIELQKSAEIERLDKIEELRVKAAKQETDRQKKMIEDLSKDPVKVLVSKIDVSPSALQEYSASIGAALGVTSNLLQGKKGATSLISGAAGAVADAYLPGAGSAVSGIVSQLAEGPEATKAMVREFINSVPEIMDAVAESMPVVVEALVDTLVNKGGAVRIGFAIARAMAGEAILMSIGKQLGLDFGDAFNAPVIGEKLSSAFTTGVQNVIDGIKGFFTGFGSMFADIGGQLTEKIKSVFKLGLDRLTAFKLPKIDVPKFPDLKFPEPGWLTSFRETIQKFVDAANIGGSGGGKGWLAEAGDKVKGVLPIGNASGGIIPAYAATGMLVPFVPRGTDTVPAMLTPGEMVLNKDQQQNLFSLLKNGSGPQEITLRLEGKGFFKDMIEKALVEASSVGTGRIRLAVGSEA